MKTFCAFVFGCLLFDLVKSENMRIIDQTKNELVLFIFHGQFGKTNEVALLGKNEVAISHVQLFRYFPILFTPMITEDSFFRSAALYNQMGLAKQEFQPVEVWVMTVTMRDILDVVNEANRICPGTITTVMHLIRHESELNTTNFYHLKTEATARQLKLGVWLTTMSRDPCVFLKTLPLQYIDQVYVSSYPVLHLWQTEFESCKFEIKSYYEAENTILGLFLNEKGLVAFNNASFHFEFEDDHDNLTLLYFQNLLHSLFNSPLIIENEYIAVKNETEYGNICYNTNDVYEWVSDETALSKHLQTAGSLLPFDPLTINISADILSTVLFTTPKILIYNIRSLARQSPHQIDLFFKALQLAVLSLNKSQGTNFTKTINITVLVFVSKNDTFNEAYAQVLWKVADVTKRWSTSLFCVNEKVDVVVGTSRKLNSLYAYLKNNTGDDWAFRLGINLRFKDCNIEVPFNIEFVMLAEVVKIPMYCQTLDKYIANLRLEKRQCEDYILDWKSKGIEVREYGAVLQAFATNRQETSFILNLPIGFDWASEFGKDNSEVQYCFHWVLSRENDPRTNESIFVLETQQQVAAKQLATQFPELYSKSSNANGGITPKPLTDSNYSLWWLLLPAVVLVFIFGFLSPAAIFRYYLNRQFQDRDVLDFFTGRSPTPNNEGDGMCMASSLMYQKEKFEKPRSSFRIDKTCCLGTGEYGEVYKSILKEAERETLVAVKTVLKTSRFLSTKNILHLKSLMAEIKVMSYIGDHNHIIKLIGANTSKLRRGRLFVFLEYCENGSLENYLRTIKTVENSGQEIEIYNVNGSNQSLDGYGKLGPDVLSLFGKWCLSVADGMQYLVTKNIVHADIAARNILLDKDYTAKISDFGLSRRLYNYTNYVKSNNQEPLPWRWMAPEALKRMEFNEKTDVWSFGVLLWEIYTLGDTPYPGLSWSIEFTKKLEDGLRLGSPKYGKEKEVYTVMLKCWATNPERRPCFSELVQMLSP